MKIGFSKREITPPIGTELAGYAAYRPCTAVHDPVFCKVVVLEQEQARYALVALDLMCVDVALVNRIQKALEPAGIVPERLLVSAIHSHSVPQGVIPGEGPMAKINASGVVDKNFANYILTVVDACREAVEEALSYMEPFRLRCNRVETPAVGSERHTGQPARGWLTVLQFVTETGRNLIVYSFPCHPTVLSAANLEVSADFLADVEGLLDCDLAVFLNAAAGDISTRFTRRESSFAECRRLARLTADSVREALASCGWESPGRLVGIHTQVELQARSVDSEDHATQALAQATERWEQAKAQGQDPIAVRLLKTYQEGAWVNLEFARTMAGVTAFRLPVTVFRFAGLNFAAVPGELFSTLLPPQPLSVLCYTNGYYRYIADAGSYDAGHYEATAAILARGQAEALMHTVTELIRQLDE